MSETLQKQKMILARYALLVFGILLVVVTSIVLAVTQKPKETAVLPSASASHTTSESPIIGVTGGVDTLPTPEATLILPEREAQSNFGNITMWEAEEYQTMIEAAGPTALSENAGTVAMVEKRVVIDPGHGGFDGGAVGAATGVHEDDLNLQIALLLKELFETNGYEVLMTRSGENAIAATKLDDMQKRYRIIENSGAEAVISIHMNFYADASVSGPQVFYYNGSSRGEILADMVSSEIERWVKPDRMRNVLAEDYYVLGAGNAPSILVECGFLSNPEEEAMLMEKDYQIKLANAIFTAADDYMETY